MKYIKFFENFENTSEQHLPYVDHENKIDGVYVVNADKDFNDNPLFYVWSEYPTYSKIVDGILHYNYEFYTDANKNKYFVCSDVSMITDEEIKEKIQKHDWNYARNVDAFVNGADKDDYAKWLDLIS